MSQQPKLKMSFSAQPYVGQLGSTNTLTVDQRPDRIVCHVSRGSMWFRQVIFFVWAMFLSFVIWTSFEERKFHIPLPFSILVWTLALACWLVFVRTLLGTPRVEVRLGSGDFLLYRFNTRSPSRTIRRSEVRSIFVDTQLYTYKASQTINYMVSLALEGDEKVHLCASPSEQVIRLLETQLTTGIASRPTKGD